MENELEEDFLQGAASLMTVEELSQELADFQLIMIQFVSNVTQRINEMEERFVERLKEKEKEKTE